MTGRQTRLLAALALCGAATFAQAQAPIKIGFMAELSGPQGALGQDQYDAFMMVVERNGGKLGGVPVQVLREDSQLKPDVATQIVQKLIEKENVLDHHRRHLLQRDDGGAQADHREGRVPDRHQRRPGADCRRAVQRPTSSSSRWQNDKQAEVVGKYATDKGYKRVICMAPNYQAGKDFVAGFKRMYKGEVIDEIYTPLNQPDFQAELAQVAAKNPEAVLVFYPGGMGINFVKQYQQAGLLGKIPLLSSCTIDGSTLPAQKEAALGRDQRHLLGPGLQQPGEQAVRRGLREEVQPHPLPLRGAELRRGAADRFGHRQGQGQRRRQEGLRGGAEGGRLQVGARQLQVRQQPLPDPGPAHLRGGQGRQGPRQPEDHRHAAEGPDDAYASQCKM